MIDTILESFECEHLPSPFDHIGQPFYEMACAMASENTAESVEKFRVAHYGSFLSLVETMVGCNGPLLKNRNEVTVALTHLLEARNALFRAFE